MSQKTLDGTTFRPRIRYKEDYKKCSRKWCTKTAEIGSDLCVGHGIDHILNYQYGLDEVLIPQITGWSAEEYYKLRRRQAFDEFVLEKES